MLLSHDIIHCSIPLPLLNTQSLSKTQLLTNAGCLPCFAPGQHRKFLCEPHVQTSEAGNLFRISRSFLSWHSFGYRKDVVLDIQSMHVPSSAPLENKGLYPLSCHDPAFLHKLVLVAETLSTYPPGRNAASCHDSIQAIWAEQLQNDSGHFLPTSVDIFCHSRVMDLPCMSELEAWVLLISKETMLLKHFDGLKAMVSGVSMVDTLDKQ